MTHFEQIYQDSARSVVGQKLESVNGLIYVFDAPDLESPQQLQLTFSSENKSLFIRCGQDGATLDLFDSPMQENDLGEYGKEIIMDLSNSCLYHKYIGKKLLRFYVIHSATEQKVIGIKLVFVEELVLVIINIGDEIKVLDSLSIEYERDEGVDYIDVLSVHKNNLPDS